MQHNTNVQLCFSSPYVAMAAFISVDGLLHFIAAIKFCFESVTVTFKDKEPVVSGEIICASAFKLSNKSELTKL